MSGNEQKEKSQRAEADGARLKAALKELGLTQAEVERKTGVPQRYLTEIISGDRKLGREQLRALAVVGLSADHLLGTDVPIRWQDRAEAGALIHALATYLEGVLRSEFPLHDGKDWSVDGREALHALCTQSADHARRVHRDEAVRRAVAPLRIQHGPDFAVMELLSETVSESAWVAYVPVIGVER